MAIDFARSESVIAYLFECGDDALFAATLDPVGSNIPQKTCPQGWRRICRVYSRRSQTHPCCDRSSTNPASNSLNRVLHLARGEEAVAFRSANRADSWRTIHREAIWEMQARLCETKLAALVLQQKNVVLWEHAPGRHAVKNAERTDAMRKNERYTSCQFPLVGRTRSDHDAPARGAVYFTGTQSTFPGNEASSREEARGMCGRPAEVLCRCRAWKRGPTEVSAIPSKRDFA